MEATTGKRGQNGQAVDPLAYRKQNTSYSPLVCEIIERWQRKLDTDCWSEVVGKLIVAGDQNCQMMRTKLVEPFTVIEACLHLMESDPETRALAERAMRKIRKVLEPPVPPT